MILGNNGLSRERFSEIFASLHSQLQAERKIFAPQAICLAHAQFCFKTRKIISRYFALIFLQSNFS